MEGHYVMSDIIQQKHMEIQYIEVIIKRYHHYTDGKKDIKCLSRDINLEEIIGEK